MFCPRCGEHNETVTGFCRACGQALKDVALALENRPGQALEKLHAAKKWINAGTATMMAFALVGMAIMIAGLAMRVPEFNYIAMLNLLLGVFIGLPLTFAGKANLKRSQSLLANESAKSASLLKPRQTTNDLLAPGTAANRISVPRSVTEDTTINLQKAERHT